MTNVMATKWQNDQHTGGKVTNEMTNVMAGTAGEWKWQTKWQEKDEDNGGDWQTEGRENENAMWENDKRNVGEK